MLIGASWPWNLSTVPTRARRRQQPRDRADLGVVRRDDQDVLPARAGRWTPVASIHDAPPSTQRSRQRGDRARPRRATRCRRRRSRTSISARPDPVDVRAAGVEPLAREVRLGLEPVVVEHLGRERAEVRVEPPGRLEEEAAVGRHRGLRRRARARAPSRSAPGGCEPCSRLVELLRVAEQDEARRGPRDRDDVGERDLAGLVDEQDVDGVGHLRRHPQPRRAGREVGPPVVELRRGRRAPRPWRGRPADRRDGPGRRRAVLDRPDGTPSASRGREDRVEEVADDLVAGAGDPDPLARRAAASRSSVRRVYVLPAPGGPWIGRTVRSSADREPARRVEVGLAGLAEGGAGRLADPRRAARSGGRGPPGAGRRRRCRGRRPTRRARAARAWCSGVPDPVERHDAPRGAASSASRLMSTRQAGLVDRDQLAERPRRTALLAGSACGLRRGSNRSRDGRGRTPGRGTRSARPACLSRPRRAARRA